MSSMGKTILVLMCLTAMCLGGCQSEVKIDYTITDPNLGQVMAAHYHRKGDIKVGSAHVNLKDKAIINIEGTESTDATAQRAFDFGTELIKKLPTQP